MNDLDRENLRFILDNSGPALEVWYNNLTIEQKNYASRLLDVYREELTLKAILVSEPLINDVVSATLVIDKFRL